MLEAGEEGVHLRQRGAMRRFQLLHGDDPAGEFTLEGEGRERNFKLLDELHVQPWHYSAAFFDAEPMLNFWMQKEACLEV